nr:MAG TPA: hypothetical protein [Caudoviricetes sp.]
MVNHFSVIVHILNFFQKDFFTYDYRTTVRQFQVVNAGNILQSPIERTLLTKNKKKTAHSWHCKRSK